MKYYSTLLLLSSFSFLSAQEISILPDSIVNGVALFNQFNYYNLQIVNDAEDTLQLSWEMVEHTLPRDWELMACDGVSCNDLVVFADFEPLPPGDTTFFTLDVNPLNKPGNGLIRFWIYETLVDINTAHQSITFYVETNTTSTAPVDLESDFELFPIPARDYIQVVNPYSEEVELTIFTIEGQLVNKINLAEEQSLKIDLTPFNAGFYLLKFHSLSSKILVGKKFWVAK